MKSHKSSMSPVVVLVRGQELLPIQVEEAQGEPALDDVILLELVDEQPPAAPHNTPRGETCDTE
ncbi:MAG: hypothetical protein K0U66_00515 [Gammaproteobacteria bacterium]|nr:hypothetical protein [Gammaproteobacteria bacterium]